eukprot:gb/GECG01009878.1/.p1 GENE.gb/GECG01009878.1/~~gb/GECG01009878.1/.p1  ORF type:complete len:215 (+),score=7.61 gb/GECG01009878.1/:1-645(+)
MQKYVSDQDTAQIEGFAIANTTRLTELLQQKSDQIEAISSASWSVINGGLFNKRKVKRDLDRLRFRLLSILHDGMYWLDVKAALAKFENKYFACPFLIHFFDLHFRTDIQLCLWHLIDNWRKRLRVLFERSVKKRPEGEYSLTDYAQFQGRLLAIFSVDLIAITYCTSRTIKSVGLFSIGRIPLLVKRMRSTSWPVGYLSHTIYVCVVVIVHDR